MCSTFVVFCGQDDVLCSRCLKDVRPFIGIEKLSGEHWGKVLICESHRIILLHEINVRLQFSVLQVVPGIKTTKWKQMFI